MRILVVGAGAVGGYFGGRLLEKGEDVTFLVRPGRREQLGVRGLVIRSPQGDFSSPVAAITRGERVQAFDLIILAVKAYHLGQALDDMAPYVGENTAILPLLNGYAHYGLLKGRFGEGRVLGGLVFIESTVGPEGEIIHSGERHHLVYGEWNGNNGQREARIQEHLSGAGFSLVLSESIQREIWKIKIR